MAFVIQRKAYDGESVADVDTDIVHACKFIDDRGGCTWCNFTYCVQAFEMNSLDDFIGRSTRERTTCFECIACMSDDEAANAEEDAWRSGAPRT